MPDRYQQVFLTLGDAVLLEDASGTILDANTAAAWLLGCPAQELIGRKSKDFLSPASVEHFTTQRQLLGSVERLQFSAQLVAAGGKPVNVILDISQLPADKTSPAGSEVYLIAARESSKRDELERELRLVRQSAGQGYADAIQSSFFVSSRQEISRYPPLTAGEAPRPLDWVAAVLSGPRLKPALERAWKGEQLALEPAWYCPVADTEHAGPAGVASGVIPTSAQPLTSRRWLRASLLPLRLRAAEVTDICVRVRDETEVRLALEEERWRERQVYGDLLAEALYHDLNNYLSVIVAQASGLKIATPPGQLPPSGVGAILDAAQQAAALLRGSARRDPRAGQDGGMVDLNALLPDCATLLAHLARGRVTVDMDLSADVPPVHGQAELLKAVILVLGRHMLGQVSTGGKMMLKTYRVRPAIPSLPASAGLSIGEEPTAGATPRAAGGLDVAGVADVSLARAVLRAHRGQLEVISTDAQGTFCEITLPGVEQAAAPSEVAAASPAAAQPAASGTHVEAAAQLAGADGARACRIILADDEENFSRFTSWVLRERGYDVVTAKDGQEAFERFQEAPESFNLVILDAYMPRMGGLEAYLRMQALRPELPVLFASGFARGPSVDALIAGCPGPAAVLLKPFSSEDLVNAVKKALTPQ
ncbi:MAG: response regulator [Planctomycetota bacterium]|nr:response regulator [Planctomycetota bacterium]